MLNRRPLRYGNCSGIVIGAYCGMSIAQVYQVLLSLLEYQKREIKTVVLKYSFHLKFVESMSDSAPFQIHKSALSVYLKAATC
jgi:hypothetical protein